MRENDKFVVIRLEVYRIVPTSDIFLLHLGLKESQRSKCMGQLHDQCGVVGFYAHRNDASIDVRRYLVLALAALQHRGQESAGIAVYDREGNIARHVGMGKVREIFCDASAGLPETHCGIGHVRYSTTGSSLIENAGPFVVGTYRSQYEP